MEHKSLIAALTRFPDLTLKKFDKPTLQSEARKRGIPVTVRTRALSSAQLALRLGVKLPRKATLVRKELEAKAKAKGIKIGKGGVGQLVNQLGLTSDVSRRLW